MLCLCLFKQEQGKPWLPRLPWHSLQARELVILYDLHSLPLHLTRTEGKITLTIKTLQALNARPPLPAPQREKLEDAIKSNQEPFQPESWSFVTRQTHPPPADLLWQLPGLLSLVFVSPAGLVQCLCPVANDADVGTEVVLLGRRGQGEGVPLQPGDRWALDEDVLAHLHAEAFLLHLQLQGLGGVHHHLRGRYGRYKSQAKSFNCRLISCSVITE